MRVCLKDRWRCDGHHLAAIRPIGAFHGGSAELLSWHGARAAVAARWLRDVFQRAHYEESAAACEASGHTTVDRSISRDSQE